MKKNPYEPRKHPGVRGNVPNDFESIKIYDRAGESVTIFLAELEKNVYDSGYDIHLPDGTHLRRYPGVGSGWFSSSTDAEGYALYAIKIAFSSRLSSAANSALLLKIQEFSSPKLNLI